MPEATREQELLAQIAALQRQVAALQSGSGGLAQGPGAVAAGQGGVAVGGNVYGNIYGGAEPRSDAEALDIYRRMILARCRYLPLRGFDLGASDPTAEQKHMDLDQVYVGLDTTETVAEEKPTDRAGRPFRGDPSTVASRKLSALEAVAAKRHTVILGDPGSGKSTFLNHLGLCLAGRGLEPNNHWLDRLSCWPPGEGSLLPIPVTLRDFARQLPEKPGTAGPRDLWSFIVKRLHDQNLAFVEDLLLAELDAGRAMALLDGLDEVPTQEQRRFVRDAVEAFAGRHQRARVIVTCRTLSYQDRRWQLAEFPPFTLAPFDEGKIDLFIAAWFADLKGLERIKPEDEPRFVQGLRTAVRRPDLRDLASNPLLLTVMALVHTHKTLPDARALLYEDAVDILLWRWDQIRFSPEGQPVGLGQLLREAQRSEVDLKRMLWRLAFEAHRAGGGQDKLADIGEVTLLNALRDLHPEHDRAWAGRMIDMVKLRAGLLLERVPNIYTFPHRTFQEHLAGAHLTSLSNFAQETSTLVEAGSFWREAILLAAGRLVYLSGDIDKPLALVAELCPETETATELAWRKAWLAGEVLNEVGLPRANESAFGRDLLARVRRRLVRLLETESLPPVERAAAGIALGKLGDPRPGVGLKNGVPEIDWIQVPPGPFTMGSKKGETTWEDETPQFRCTLLKQPYQISRYPVTVAQYQAFVDAGGYGESGKRYWTAAGWEWTCREKITGPADYETVYQTPNHPRVGVCWYEAVAYCRWLSELLKLEITLPSEAEWERAARGKDARVYPWGSKKGDEPQRCNMAGTGIGHTSAVGIFPSGLAACGAADMAGNVWEWCRTKWLDGYVAYEKKADDGLEGDERRVLRGGAFGNSPGRVRCAYRDRYLPYARDSYRGFRVVASPSGFGL